LKDDIFWLVLKLEISYNRVTIYFEGFWFRLEAFFGRLLFWNGGEIYEFP
jgi:hypothetical protein